MNHQPVRSDRKAAIAVIVRERKFLVIERAATVRAPGQFCFPGGEVEPQEQLAEALIRELHEELELRVKPVRQIWTSMAPSGCQLNWIHTELNNLQDQPQPNPREVASWAWMNFSELAQHPAVLPSNVEFLAALANGHIHLPDFMSH